MIAIWQHNKYGILILLTEKFLTCLTINKIFLRNIKSFSIVNSHNTTEKSELF